MDHRTERLTLQASLPNKSPADRSGAVTLPRVNDCALAGLHLRANLLFAGTSFGQTVEWEDRQRLMDFVGERACTTDLDEDGKVDIIRSNKLR